MVRIIKQHVAFANCIKAVTEFIEPQMAQTRHRFIHQIGFADVGEADKVFKIVVTTARQHRVVVRDGELVAQHFDHRVRHIALIDEAHRLGGQTLLQAGGHQLHQARFHLMHQIVFGITRHFHRVGIQRIVIEKALEDIIQTIAQNVV